MTQLAKNVVVNLCAGLDFMKNVSNEKIKNRGERVFSRINDFTGKSLICFSTLYSTLLYSTLLYSTTTILHTNNYLTTTLFANCKQTTTFFAGVVC